MKSTLTRRLVRLEKARMGVKSLSDEDLERGIDLSLASLGGQSLTPSEKAELARIP